MKRLLLFLAACTFALALISAASDAQVWQGQYYTGTTFNSNTQYIFNFTVYDAVTGGTICYSNTTLLTTGNWGEWKTEQFGVLKSCADKNKDYFLNINIQSIDQTPRRRLMLNGNRTTYELTNAYEKFWYNNTYTGGTYNLSYDFIFGSNFTMYKGGLLYYWDNTLFGGRGGYETTPFEEKWMYNMTLPFTNWLNTFNYNYNQTSAAVTETGWFHNMTSHVTYAIDATDKICFGSGCQINPFYKFTIEGGLNVTGNIENDGVFKTNVVSKSIEFFINLTTNNLTATGTTKLNSLNTTNGAYIQGNLFVLGNMSIKRPYGMYSSTQTQTVASAGTAYPMTFNWTEDSYLINKASDNSNFSSQQTGDYLIELSIIADVTSGNNKHVDIWVQKNGVNVPRSNTKIELPSAGVEQLIVVPFILDMNTTDIFRIMYTSDTTAGRLLYTAASGAVPETPSAIMSITKISELTP